MEIEEMGMTDKQFKDHIRGIIDSLEHVRDAKTVEEKDAELDKMLKRFRATLED